MTAMEHIKAAQNPSADKRDGKSKPIELTPPLKAEEIETLQTQVGQPLPLELRSLLAFCTGIDGVPFEIDFTGSSMAFEDKAVFPHGLPIAHDGCGNFWVLDVTPDTTDVAPIFFACHDPPVVLYQCANIGSFLAELFRTSSSRERSALDSLGDGLSYVWRKNPSVIDRATGSQSSDASVRAFALGLPEDFQIIDLRSVKPGMGFSWGRYGPRTEIRRHGYDRIFAYAKPQQSQSVGFFRRLFGG